MSAAVPDCFDAMRDELYTTRRFGRLDYTWGTAEVGRELDERNRRSPLPMP